MKLVFATNNEHKLSEVKKISEGKYEILSLKELNFSEEISEDYFTLEENAMQKARFIYANFNVDCFADDTGLEVETLNGEPGVFSARYAGENKSSSDNIQKLLKNLEHTNNRNAKFRTIVALIVNGKEFLFEGIINGKLTKECKGINGFGYDSVFVPDGYDKTFAEFSDSEKNAISHRALALEKLFVFLKNNYEKNSK